MPQRRRAVQITRFGGPEVLDVVDLPDPVPRDGEHLDEVSAAGVNYADTHQRLAAIQNRHLVVVPVPLLSPRLSSRWLALVTDVDVATGKNLVDSMTNEVVVTDDAIRTVVPFEPLDYDEMVLRALIERARERRR